MWVTVCSERSSCPCLCSGVDEKSVSRSVGSWDFQGAFPVKEKYRPCSIAMDFVGWNSGKMNRVCCGAVNLSGMIHGEAVFKMNTTASCGEIQVTPQNQWNLQEKIPRYVECVKRILKNLLCKIEKSTTHSIFLLPLQAASANFCKGAWPKWSSVSSCS